MRLTLFVTNECNLACGYCYVPKSPASWMDAATAQQALRTSRGRVGWVTYFGGEPFIDPDRLMGIHRSLGDSSFRTNSLKFSLTTNGTLISPELAEWCAKELKVVVVSLDVGAGAHDTHRRTRGDTSTRERALHGFKMLLEARANVGVGSVLSPDALIGVAANTVSLVESGARRVSHTPNVAVDWSPDRWRCLSVEYEVLAQQYAEWILAGREVRVGFLDRYLHSMVLALSVSGGCSGDGGFLVMQDGTVLPCDTFVAEPERWRLGNVHEDADIAPFSSACGGIRRRARCEGCAARFGCTTCACLNYLESGEPGSQSSALCEFQRLCHATATRVHGILSEQGESARLISHLGLDRVR